MVTWMRGRRFAWVGLVALFVASAGAAAAQELSVLLSLDATSYDGDAYTATDGDRGGEVAVGIQMSRLRFTGGVFVGKFDEPISDPSLTALSLFFEPAWMFRRSARVRPVIGPRAAWEHQRVGDQSAGLWAYGWSVGGLAGVLVRLGEPISVGARAVVSGLNMERENGTSRNGLRVQLGGTVVLTWPLQ
jgi:hypothetical protein